MSTVQIVFGVLLVGVLLFLSLFYAWRQVRALRELRSRQGPPDEEALYERAKARRRLVSCALTLLLGRHASRASMKSLAEGLSAAE